MFNYIKGLGCFTLVSVILLQAFYATFILSDYSINKEFIAKVLCINKNKPEVSCNGKCHLKKRLDQQNKKENLPASKLNTNKNGFLVFCQPLSKIAIFPQMINKNFLAFVLSAETKGVAMNIFHPPQNA